MRLPEMRWGNGNAVEMCIRDRLWDDCPGGLASIVGAHHGKPQSCAAVDDQLECWESNYYPKGQEKVWQGFWTELLMTVLQDLSLIHI